MEDGDIIDIDIPNRSIDVRLSEAELAARRADKDARDAMPWTPAEPRPRKLTKALKAYAMLTTSASKGAIRQLPDGV